MLRVALDVGVAAHRVRTIESLEIQEIGIIDHAGDDLTDVVGLAVVGRHHAGEFVGRIAWLLERFLLLDWKLRVPGQLGYDLARCEYRRHRLRPDTRRARRRSRI